jgi:hypothetical protein
MNRCFEHSLLIQVLGARRCPDEVSDFMEIALSERSPVNDQYGTQGAPAEDILR